MYLYSLEGRGGWSTSGCSKLAEMADAAIVTCYCNHFTHFAVIAVSYTDNDCNVELNFLLIIETD